MCGLTGFWRPTGLHVGDDAIVARMNQTLQQRGPDSHGVWLDHSAGVALGHRRLAVLDLSPAGHQPMVSPSGRYVTVYNGELYNYRSIALELEAHWPDLTWRGGSDTEVMLAAFDAWGVERATERFEGMFGLAVWDRREQLLHLVRDRVGIKPLCYGLADDGSLLFGSDLRALRAYPAFSTAIDRRALASYMRFACVPSPATIYERASKVEPGTILTFRDPRHPPTENVYWSAAAGASIRSARRGTWRDEAEAVAALEDLLRDAVRLRMLADVPLGAFLSGGIDSSLIVAFMHEQSTQPIRTFTIGNELADYDESSPAAAVAAHLGTEHTCLTVNGRDALAVVPELPSMYDEPFADSSQIPTYLVSKLARRHVTVALSGDGGDELFGGYNRHFWGPHVWRVLDALPQPLRRGAATAIQQASPEAWDRVFAPLGRFSPVRLPGDKLHKLAAVLPASSADEVFLRLQSQWPDPPSLLHGAPSELPVRRIEGQSLAEEMMMGDLLRYLPDDILAKLDRASMAVSLEARVPLLDHRVVEFSWELPLRMKIRGLTGKWILRRILRTRVPQEHWDRPKTGFGVPIGDWLRGPLRDWAEELLDAARLRHEGFLDPAPVRTAWMEHQSKTTNRQHELWTVLMFQAWFESTRQPTLA